MGQVCQRHNQFYEETCRWCEVPAAAVSPFGHLANAVLAVIESRMRIAENSLRYRLGHKEWRTEVGSTRSTPAAEPDLSESPLDRHGGCE